MSGTGYLPVASTTEKGAVIADGLTIAVDAFGVISVPQATTEANGISHPDGTTIDISPAGVLSVDASVTGAAPNLEIDDGMGHDLTRVRKITTSHMDVGGTSAAATLGPVLATTVNPGIMQPDGATLYVNEAGIENAVTATASTLGVMQPDGSTIEIDEIGVISAVNQGIELTDGAADLHGVTKLTTTHLVLGGAADAATLIPATATTGNPGISKPDGSTITIAGDVLSAAPGTASDLGIWKPDGTSIVAASAGVLSVPLGTVAAPGELQPDGTTIHVSEAGVISAAPPTPPLSVVDGSGTKIDGVQQLVLDDATIRIEPAVPGGVEVAINRASATHFGLCEVDGTTITATSGVISAAAGAGLPAGTQGDILRHGASVWGSLAAGTAGDVLTSDGADVSYQPARIAMAANSAAPTGTRNEIDIGNTDGYIAITATDDSAANTVHYSIDGSDALHAALGLGAVITILTDTTWVAKNLWNGSSTDAPPTGWQTAGFDDAAWTAAVPNPSGGIYPVPSDATPIWSENPITATGEGCLVRKRVVLPAGIITGATISSNADDLCHAISVNGVQVQSYAAPGARGVQTAALSPSLLVAGGSNIIAAWAEDAYGQPAMIAIRIDITYNAHSSAAKVTVAHDGVVVGTESEINFIAGSNVTLTVADDSVDGRVDVTIGASGGDGGAAVTHSTYLAANVTLTTAGVYYDIVSLSLEAGTWLLIGVLYIANPGSGGPGGAGAKLWDGTTVASASETTIPTAGYQSTLTLAAVVSPDSTTTYKISAVSQNNNAIVHADAEDFSNGNTASYLHAVRLGSGSGSGSTLTVEGGGGTVDTVTTLDFTSGATVSGTSPTANVAIADLTASGSGHHGGLAPDPGSTPGTSAYLREDAQWVIPSGQNLHGHIEVSGDVSVPSGTWTTVLSLTPSAGLWMFWGTVTIAGGASQPAFARIWDGTNDRGSAGGTLGASTGLTSYVCLSMSSDAIPLDGSTPVHLQAYVAAGSPDALALHNAGSIGLSALTHLRCIHVGD